MKMLTELPTGGRPPKDGGVWVTFLRALMRKPGRWAEVPGSYAASATVVLSTLRALEVGVLEITTANGTRYARYTGRKRTKKAH